MGGPWNPGINNDGWVVWNDWDGSDYEIFLYDGTSTTQITNNVDDDFGPQINDNGYVVWRGSVEGTSYAPYQLFLYDGTSTTQITDLPLPSSGWFSIESLDISNNGQVVWVQNPALCGLNTVFLYDGISTIALSQLLGWDLHYCIWTARINDDGKVVYDADGKIFLAKPMGYSATANAEASTYGSESLTGSGVFNSVALLLVPIGAVVVLRVWRRKR